MMNHTYPDAIDTRIVLPRVRAILAWIAGFVLLGWGRTGTASTRRRCRTGWPCRSG